MTTTFSNSWVRARSGGKVHLLWGGFGRAVCGSVPKSHTVVRTDVAPGEIPSNACEKCFPSARKD